MRLSLATTSLLIVLATAACAARTSRPASHPTRPIPTADWLAQDTVYCGEVRGQVLDARTGVPLTDASISTDSATQRIPTDSLGRFRIRLTPSTGDGPSRTRATMIRIRRLGMSELQFYLPPDLGYSVEARLASAGLHFDHISTLRIKTPGFCARAT